MPPSAQTPRLAVLDPAAVGREVEQLVRDHLARLAFGLAPAATLHTTPDTGSDLRLTVEALTSYAQTGQDAETDAPAIAAEYARDRCSTVLDALYRRAADGPAALDAEALVGESDPTTAAGVVLRAAWARAALDSGEPVTLPQLAALASLSARAVQAQVAEGRLRAKDGAVRAADARAWLEEREADRRVRESRARAVGRR